MIPHAPLLSLMEPILAVAVSRGLCVSAYLAAQTLLVLYACHRYVVLRRWWRSRSGPRPVEPRWPRNRDAWPRVTVQLPIYNEPWVAERAIAAAAALDYPRDRLEIQVLDDSTDDTRRLAARAAAAWRAGGIDIVHLYRRERLGFKAGALAGGLERSQGELVAVFDADFVPPPEFLRRLVPCFADPGVGMVQARWGHLNRGRSLLTAAQAVMLDAHFLLEHSTREAEGLFFNFNGTAGVWRRACIEDAGGWSDDTLTEDLDLSYRAQLRGWRFRFAPEVVVPAELPSDIAALKSQQRRWTKGSIQVARKVIPTLLASSRAPRVQWEALVHLTGNAAYPLLLALGLLLLPVLLAIPSTDPWLIWGAQIGVWCFGVAPTLLFLAIGQRLAGASWRETIRGVCAAVVLGVGLSLNNTRAVLQGLGGRVGAWERTPKTGDRGVGRSRPSGDAPARAAESGVELVLATYFAGLAVFIWRSANDRAMPFALLLLAGFGWVAWSSLAAWRRGASG